MLSYRGQRDCRKLQFSLFVLGPCSLLDEAVKGDVNVILDRAICKVHHTVIRQRDFGPVPFSKFRPGSAIYQITKWSAPAGAVPKLPTIIQQNFHPNIGNAQMIHLEV